VDCREGVCARSTLLGMPRDVKYEVGMCNCALCHFSIIWVWGVAEEQTAWSSSRKY